jgi:hypothetical protein
MIFVSMSQWKHHAWPKKREVGNRKRTDAIQKHLCETKKRLSLAIIEQNQLRGNFFQCHVFAMKSVQNLKYFWRSSQNYFVLALFSSL